MFPAEVEVGLKTKPGENTYKHSQLLIPSHPTQKSTGLKELSATFSCQAACVRQEDRATLSPPKPNICTVATAAVAKDALANLSMSFQRAGTSGTTTGSKMVGRRKRKLGKLQLELLRNEKVNGIEVTISRGSEDQLCYCSTVLASMVCYVCK